MLPGVMAIFVFLLEPKLRIMALVKLAHVVMGISSVVCLDQQLALLVR